MKYEDEREIQNVDETVEAEVEELPQDALADASGGSWLTPLMLGKTETAKDKVAKATKR